MPWTPLPSEQLPQRYRHPERTSPRRRSTGKSAFEHSPKGRMLVRAVCRNIPSRILLQSGDVGLSQDFQEGHGMKLRRPAATFSRGAGSSNCRSNVSSNPDRAHNRTTSRRFPRKGIRSVGHQSSVARSLALHYRNVLCDIF